MKKTAKTFLIFALAVTTLIGCKTETTNKQPDRVSVRLKWHHQSQFAGFYAAEQKGFYADENITAVLEPGGIDIDEVEMVVSGKDDFGVVAAPEIITRVAQDSPIKAIAVIFRRNPAVYFALKDSGIVKPEDFVDRKVLVFPRDYALPAVLAKVGVTMNQIIAVPHTFTLESFFAGKVDVWTGYLTNQLVTARKKGYKLNLIFPDAYGVHIYSDTIIASDKLIEEKPDLVERFLRATLRGWRWAIENPKEAAMFVLKYGSEKDKERLIAEMEYSVPLIHTGRDQIGWMEDKTWQGMHKLLIDQGVLKKPCDLRQVYTKVFLERIYRRES
jgi:NitT/TauT family transport system substrate-binding protein